MELYFNSLIFILIGSVFVIPLIILKGVSKYATLLFYLVLIAATILRPNFLGIDNLNLINAITKKEEWTDEALKYNTIYYITYFIPGTWQKIVGLNLISTLITIFSFKKIFKSIKIENKTKYIILLYMSYFLGIGTPLILIHARQYFAFSILLILINLYRSKNKKDLLYELPLSIFVLSIHPIFISFIIFYFVCKYFKEKIIYFFKYSTNLTKVFLYLIISLPFIFIFNNINYYYTSIIGNLSGYESYAVQLITTNYSINFSSKLYLLILVLPIIFILINCRKSNESNNLISVLVIYLIFSLPLVLLELKLNNLYSISRVKSGLYPAIFLILFHLENFNIGKKTILWSTLILITLNTYSILRLYKSL